MAQTMLSSGLRGGADALRQILVSRKMAELQAQKDAETRQQRAFENDQKERLTRVQETEAEIAGRPKPTAMPGLVSVRRPDGVEVRMPDQVGLLNHPAQPVARPEAKTDYGDFLSRFAASKSKTVEQLSSADELEARKAWGQSDDRPQNPFIITMGPNGPLQVNRNDATARPVTDAGGNQVQAPLTAGERTQELAAEGASDTMAEIRKLYKPEYVGPVGSFLYGVREKLPEGTPETPLTPKLDKQRSQFNAAVAGNRNRIINLITGAAVGVQEAARIMREIPQETDPETVFNAKMAQSEANIRMMEQRIAERRAFQSTPNAPGATQPAAAAPSAVERINADEWRRSRQKPNTLPVRGR